jgi:hypothetical protein
VKHALYTPPTTQGGHWLLTLSLVAVDDRGADVLVTQHLPHSQVVKQPCMPCLTHGPRKVLWEGTQHKRRVLSFLLHCISLDRSLYTTPNVLFLTG